MRRASACVIVMIVGIGLASQALAQQEKAPPAATQPAATKPAAAAPAPVLCPVTNKPVSWNEAARYRGRWVYFANAEARQQFEREPERFAEAVKAQWAAYPPARTQVRCPVTGEAPAPDIFVGQGEEAVFFANEEAKEKWNKDSSAYKAKVDKECYTYQTTCATCSNLINPKASKDVDGRLIYFCCMGCAGNFDAKKAEYVKNVDQQIQANKLVLIRRMLEQKLGETPKPSGAPAGQGKSG